MLTVRIDLQDATPPIWGRLELRSNLSLENVHDVLQTALGWASYHLWRFSAGGGPSDPHSQQFLCQVDVDEGVSAGEIRLGELLQKRGDRLEYIYDYGDGWDLRIVVESVRQAEDCAAPAHATGGRLAAPPEDCGGLRDAITLATVLEEPARFDLTALDQELWAESVLPSSDDEKLPDLLTEPLRALGRRPAGRAARERADLLRLLPDPPGETEGEHALRAVSWFLEQADSDRKIPLTGAGYLRAVAVEAASAIVPQKAGRSGKHNREVQSAPLL